MTVAADLADLTAAAESRLRSGSAAERDCARADLVRLGRIRKAIANDPAQANLVHDVLLLSRASAEPTPAEVRSRYRYSDQELRDAVESAGSIAAAARMVGCARRTIERRLDGCDIADVALPALPSPRPQTDHRNPHR